MWRGRWRTWPAPTPWSRPATAPTRVTYQLEVALGVPVPGFLMRQAAKQIVRSALSDLKRRVESM